MKASRAQQQALAAFLGRIYEEIRIIESEYGIQANEGDYRPRIDYFYDAVRAYTAGSHGYEATGRLTVESLAYDVALLRQITANPTARVTIPQRLSPSTDVEPHQLKAYRSFKPNSEVRYLLMHHYQHYALLFVALLVEACDRNYYNRIAEHDVEVEDMATLEHALRHPAPDTDIPALIAQLIGDPDLKRRLLSQLKGKPPDDALNEVKAVMKETNLHIARIEKAHLHYLSAQLAIYEESRELVKKMALAGMNIVGDFLASAMSEATRGNRVR